MTEEQLTALLRLKRYEQPPAGYYDTLLRDVQRRQREDALRQPAWRVAWERFGTFFSEHSMGHGTYAGAMALVLVAGVTAIGLLTPSLERQQGSGLSGPLADNPVPRLNLQVAAPREPGKIAAWSTSKRQRPTEGLNPRYVIDVRPASYEPSFSF